MSEHGTTPLMSASTTPPASGAGPPAPAPSQAPFVARLLIVLFAASYLCVALWLLLDIWVLEQASLRGLLGLGAGATLTPAFLSALHSMIGAVLGAGVLDIVSFHRYVAVKGDFQSRHVWGYFFAPLLAAVLGLIVFALLQSGLLVFAGGAKDDGGDPARLGYLAVGFLAGFGWHEATENIRSIVKRFFASGSEPVARDRPLEPAGAGQPAPAADAEPGAARAPESRTPPVAPPRAP